MLDHCTPECFSFEKFKKECVDRDKWPTRKPIEKPSRTPSLSPAPSSEPTPVKPSVSPAPTASCACANCLHTSGCNPDPHYYTWDGSFYDFQGGCDQIAIDNPILQLQIRTRPRGFYSTATQAALLMKSSGEIFHIDVGLAGFISTDTLATDAVSSNPSSTQWKVKFLADTTGDSFILFNRWGTNLSIQVQGRGIVFCHSDGMFGSWDNGGVQFTNGTPYSTAGSWAVTAGTSPALALDWSVPAANNILTNPSTLCDGISTCGAVGSGSTFTCTSTRRQLQKEIDTISDNCLKTCDDITEPIMKSACKEDLKILNGNNYFTCQPSYLKPLVIDSDPCDFSKNDDLPICKKRVCKGCTYMQKIFKKYSPMLKRENICKMSTKMRISGQSGKCTSPSFPTAPVDQCLPTSCDVKIFVQVNISLQKRECPGSTCTLMVLNDNTEVIEQSFILKKRNRLNSIVKKFSWKSQVRCACDTHKMQTAFKCVTKDNKLSYVIYQDAEYTCSECEPMKDIGVLI